MAKRVRREGPIFTMFRRLRRCKRCGHFPCPWCVTWCDVMGQGERKAPPLEPPLGSNIQPRVWKQILEVMGEPGRILDDETDDACPCADDGRCLMTWDDWKCNEEVLEIFFELCDQAEAAGTEVHGDGITDDGRLIAHGTWEE